MTLLGADRSEQCRFQRASVIAAGNVRPRRRQLRSKWPKLATLIDDSETDVLSYLYFHEPDQFVRYGGRLQPPHRAGRADDLEQVGGVRRCVRHGVLAGARLGRPRLSDGIA